MNDILSKKNDCGPEFATLRKEGEKKKPTFDMWSTQMSRRILNHAFSTKF